MPTTCVECLAALPRTPTDSLDTLARSMAASESAPWPLAPLLFVPRPLTTAPRAGTTSSTFAAALSPMVVQPSTRIEASSAPTLCVLLISLVRPQLDLPKWLTIFFDAAELRHAVRFAHQLVHRRRLRQRPDHPLLGDRQRARASPRLSRGLFLSCLDDELTRCPSSRGYINKEMWPPLTWTHTVRGVRQPFTRSSDPRPRAAVSPCTDARLAAVQIIAKYDRNHLIMDGTNGFWNCASRSAPLSSPFLV